MNRLFFSALVGLLLTGAVAQAQIKPQNGNWRGTFTVANGQEAPFNFELKGATAWLLNGSERFELTGVRQTGDSLFLPVDVYDAVLAARIVDGKTLTGAFRRAGVSYGEIPFRAEWGKRYRFAEKPAAATVNLQGNWDVTIGKDSKTVGVFEQKGSQLAGTFLSTTGDYRYFEGSVQGDEFQLSAFSGSSPSLIKGKINGDNLTGEFIGVRSAQPIAGTRNAQAALPDAYGLTKANDNTPFDFTFPDAFTGKPVSLKDPKFKNKVVIVTILGSWCPNCIDEANFLVPWYKANRQRGVEIIGLAFERKNDPAFAKARLEVLKKRLGIEYDILFAGPADPKHVAETLPALKNFQAFPTTIYVNRQGQIDRIHTGYSGPATGHYYTEFVREFNSHIDQLLKESPAKASAQQTGK